MKDWAHIKSWEKSRIDNIRRKRRNNKILLGIALVLAFGLGYAAKAMACGDESTNCTACVEAKAICI